MAFFQKVNNVNFSLPDKAYNLNDKTVDEKFDIALRTGVFNESDKKLMLSLTDDLKKNDFSTSLSNFKKRILEANLSNKKFGLYNIAVNSLMLIHYVKPSLFDLNSTESNSNPIDCIIAIIAFICAFIALVTLEVGTAGLATAVVVVGYIAASTAMVRAC